MSAPLTKSCYFPLATPRGQDQTGPQFSRIHIAQLRARAHAPIRARRYRDHDLAAIAEVVGRPVGEVEAEARALNLFFGVDWADRPAISCSDAYGLASGRLARDAEHQQRHLEWVNARVRWERDKESARRQAFQQAYDDARRAGFSNSRATNSGYDAAAAAIADFERSSGAAV